MLHRYQIEAAAKAIGGLNYLYYVKNNNNYKVKPVDKDLQIKSLKSLLKVLSTENLVLPDNLINLLTPDHSEILGLEKTLFQRQESLLII